MTSHLATCSCGQLRVTADRDPFRVSVCHCLACQRRTGSAFGVQARFEASHVTLSGEWSEYSRVSDTGGEKRTFRFCPSCGGTVFFQTGDAPDVVGVPVGAFADPSFPAPRISVWESRQHGWLDMPPTLEHHEGAP